ncbi:hypothetical protein P7K49_033007 [Saguinus oedipus]|uniref:Ubiquitin-like domain-containing protein n=1 Tax=Saguinus oedipus TaxID=9490 RepID=A0ABQ9TRF9_SAGOE|nr:hypothetical protein P7K49_033007 [Saguinus oedipus]
MWIQVRTMDGRQTHTVDSLSRLTKVEELRRKIQELFHVEPGLQRLFYRGKQVHPPPPPLFYAWFRPRASAATTDTFSPPPPPQPRPVPLHLSRKKSTETSNACERKEQRQDSQIDTLGWRLAFESIDSGLLNFLFFLKLSFKIMARERSFGGGRWKKAEEFSRKGPGPIP